MARSLMFHSFPQLISGFEIKAGLCQKKVSASHVHSSSVDLQHKSTLYSPPAQDRENSLRTITSRSDIFRSITIDTETREGIFLPAPSTIQLSVSVPTQGVFSTEYILVPPEIKKPAQPKAEAALIFSFFDEQQELLSKQVLVDRDEYTKIRIPLDAYSGKNLRLTIESKPIGSYHQDYVFLANPVVYTPKEVPKRIAMIFIDTLRYDALSLHGYHRPTSPNIDHWSKTATVYTQAYSVSPWTLPAAKTMLSGRQPEQWNQYPLLQQTLFEKGWATGFFAGNVYLSTNFGLASHWSQHRCENWPRAEIQIARAQDFIQAHPDRDLFLVLHLMDMHLPYTEPLAYRELFAPPRPSLFSQDQFTRKEILKRYAYSPAEIKEYVRGRYDNNLRYIDDSLKSLFSLFSSYDTVAIISDHGEEFWEHDGFEHGHSLYEELIRIPFIIQSPNIPSGTLDTRISLLDLAPTLAIDAGIDIHKMTGIPLQQASSSTSEPRRIGFGRPLYGDDSWGNIFEDYKYTTRGGLETLFYLPDDPAEQNPLQEDTADILKKSRADLTKALEMPIREGFVLKLNAAHRMFDTVVRISVPEGFSKVWTGDTTIGSRKIELKQTSPIEYQITWPAKQKYCVEVFVVLSNPNDETDMTISFDGHEQQQITVQNSLSWRQIRLHKQLLSINKLYVPVPKNKTSNQSKYDVEAELKALGYQE